MVLKNCLAQNTIWIKFIRKIQRAMRRQMLSLHLQDRKKTTGLETKPKVQNDVFHDVRVRL